MVPSKSKSQHNFMELCASDSGRKRATKPCPPKKVAKEYVAADARKKRSVSKRKNKR